MEAKSAQNGLDLSVFLHCLPKVKAWWKKVVENLKFESVNEDITRIFVTKKKEESKNES